MKVLSFTKNMSEKILHLLVRKQPLQWVSLHCQNQAQFTWKSDWIEGKTWWKMFFETRNLLQSHGVHCRGRGWKFSTRSNSSHAQKSRRNCVEKSLHATKKNHLQVLQEMEMKHPIFKGASNTKIISWIKNSRSKLNGNNIYRTIEMENLAKVKNSNLFFTF